MVEESKGGCGLRTQCKTVMERMLVSLIVPVYRNPALVEKAVRSALSQTWEHLEILLIDDGSPDGCDAVCDALASEDARIRVFHTENRGVSAARNHGLQHAKGEFIAFLDSDDLLEPNHMEALVGLMEKGADVASVSMRFYMKDGKPKPFCDDETICTLTPREAICMMHREEAFNGYLMNKMFRRDLLGGVSFDETIAIHEDMLFIWGALLKSRNVLLQKVHTYHYLFNAASAMNRSYSPRYDTAVTAAEKMLGLMGEHFPKELPLAEKTLLFAVLSVANRRAVSGVLDRASYQRLKSVLKTHHSKTAYCLIDGVENRISYNLLRQSRILFLFWKKLLPIMRKIQG